MKLMRRSAGKMPVVTPRAALGRPALAPAQDRLESWLPRRAYLPQPYEQLAGVYRQDGNERAARAVSVGKQRVMRARHRQWWIQWPSQAWSALLRWTIGYGYRPTPGARAGVLA